jgi:hypothetical protein
MGKGRCMCKFNIVKLGCEMMLDLEALSSGAKSPEVRRVF